MVTGTFSSQCKFTSNLPIVCVYTTGNIVIKEVVPKAVDARSPFLRRYWLAVVSWSSCSKNKWGE